MRWVPQFSKSSENPSRSDRDRILGTGIPNNHLITQRRGPSEWSSCGIAIVGIAACPPGLNSARAAAACRSVRDAVMQVSLRLQDCQEHCSLQSAPRMQVQVLMLDPSSTLQVIISCIESRPLAAPQE
jgi:hypothetical protein